MKHGQIGKTKWMKKFKIANVRIGYYFGISFANDQ